MKKFQEIQKSKSDKREYKAIELPNQIQCLLISDKDTQKSAAALSVGVGSFKDPLNAQGLAHYLEHMLFMGTEKYPDENDYSNFITKNSGSNNAYTGQDQTNYHFQVSSTVFKQTLDRFAQFFIGPLMSDSSSERELNAVDSEHQKNLNNDNWRKFQLTKHLAKQNHPYNKFSTGDKSTLTNQNLKSMLHQFYKANYSANLMKLVIYGKEDLNILEEWTRQIFAGVPNKQYNRFKISQHPYDDKAFGKIIKIVPVQDRKSLQVEWILPDQRKYYRNKPGNIISHLIGHQGKGSLLSWLISEGLATQLSCGGSDSYSCYSQFMVLIQLTDKGLENYRQILGYLFYYIEMLKTKKVPQWCFQQIQYINKMKFDFLDKKKGLMHTASIASSLHKRKIEQIFVQPYLMQEWKPQLIEQYLNELKQDNMFVLCSAQQHQQFCDCTQPVYKTKFNKSDLGLITPIPCDVDLPQKNIFIPKDLSILPMAPQQQPKKIFQSEYICAHFKRDHFFNLPKVNLSLRISFPGNNCPRQRTALTIYHQMLNQSLRQFAYLAETAHVEAQISFVSFFSIQIKIKCYRDSLYDFINSYLQKIFDFKPENEQIYKTIVEKKRRQYKNFFYGDAYQLVYNYASYSMRHNSAILPEIKLEQIQNITLQKVKASADIWKQQTYSEIYCGGNITQQRVKNIVELIEDYQKKHSKSYPKHLIPQIRPVALRPNQIAVIQHKLENKEQNNSAVLVHFQTQVMSTVKFQLLHKLAQTTIKQPAFDYLRTKHQLGYVVFFMAEDHRGVGGFAIIVQSSIKTSYQIITYIDNFLNQHLKEIIQNLDEKTFDQTKKALKQTKQEDDKNLSAQTTRYWAQIVKHKYKFNRKQQEIAQISQITLHQFKEFIHEYLYANPKRIQSHFSPQSQIDKNNEIKQQRLKAQTSLTIYKNIPQFCSKHALLPDNYCP